MAYEENDKKFAVVINKRIEGATLLNAVAHTCLGLTQTATDSTFLDYAHDGTGIGARISQYPVIVFAAKNPNQVRTFVNAASAARLPLNYFTAEMIAESAAVQIAANRTTPWEELDFICAAVFGDREVVDPLTKKFSLFK